MCTVTIVPTAAAGGGIRLVCNRDELRTRPKALPPELRHYGLQRALHPIDPVSDGTWIAASNVGLVMALLNINLESREPVSLGDRLPPAISAEPLALRSRGTIIPTLLSSSDLQEALIQASRLNAGSFPPFRLVLTDRLRVASVISDGKQFKIMPPVPVSAPILFTSSGLGDDVVEKPRRALFGEIFSRPGDVAALQDELHWHQWSDRPQLSVRMSRSDARTVSMTTVELDSRQVTMTYHELPEDASNGVRPVPLQQTLRLT